MSKFVTLHGFGGSGDSELNFEIVGGTTEPTNPKENTIWVNTDVDISSWVFSAEEPSNPAEGMVWITIGTFSPVAFNILTENINQVYPICVEQYVSGLWVYKPTLSYQNGEWIDWSIYLYNHGNEFESITGGWKLVKERSNGSFVNSGEELIITAGGVDNGVAVVTNNKIDLTNSDTIYFNVSTRAYSGSNNYSDFFVTNAGNSTWSHISTTVAKKHFGNGVTGEGSIDVSSLSGEYYIGFSYYGGNATKLGCSEMWME